MVFRLIILFRKRKDAVIRKACARKMEHNPSIMIGKNKQILPKELQKSFKRDIIAKEGFRVKRKNIKNECGEFDKQCSGKF